MALLLVRSGERCLTFTLYFFLPGRAPDCDIVCFLLSVLNPIPTEENILDEKAIASLACERLDRFPDSISLFDSYHGLNGLSSLSAVIYDTRFYCVKLA